jgi:PRTRC genetic system protein B
MSLFVTERRHTSRACPTVQAVQALIVYETRSPSHGRRDYAFSTHPINHTVRGIELGAGRMLSVEEQQRLISALLGAHVGKRGFLPQEVLCHSPDQLAWYVPGRVRPLWFRDGTGPQHWNVPWPTLVFRVRNGRLSLAALGSRRRPGENARVFHAPLMNIHASCEMCTGNVSMPKGWSLSHRAGYERAVFDTIFTHVNHEHTLRSTSDGPVGTADHLRFWRELAHRDSRRFPIGVLVPLESNLSQWLHED